MGSATEILSNGVDPVAIPASRPYGGVGYVILSRTEDRSSYVANCYRNNIITIINNTGEIINNCFVDKAKWNDLTFPETLLDRGSCVVWMNIPILNRVVIVGILPKRDEMLTNITEQTATMGKQLPKSTAEVRANSATGDVHITAKGEGEGGNVLINITHKDILGALKVFVQGSIEFDAEKNFVVNTKDGFKFTCADEDTEKQTVISYIAGEGYNIADEFGNIFKLNQNGAEIIDCNGNTISASEKGVKILDKNNNIISTDSNGAKILVPSGKSIVTAQYNPAAAEAELTTSTGTLAESTIDVFKSIISGMSDMCDNMSSLGVIVSGSAGTVDPATKLLITKTKLTIKQIEATLDKIKSKNVKLT